MASEITQNQFADIAENIRAIRDIIAQRQAQSPYHQEVTLMAVTKTVDAERINYAIDHCGIRCIGENRVQELCDKYPLLHLDEHRSISSEHFRQTRSNISPTRSI